jgi:hypothetical protein
MFMRPLIISALAGALVGCTSTAPQQAQQASLMEQSATDISPTDSGAKVEKALNAKTICPPHRRKATNVTKTVKANRVPKMDTASPVEPVDKSRTSINAQSTAATKTETQQAAQPDNKSSISINAQSTAAAKTEIQQTAQPGAKPDPVLNKAVSAILAKMQNSASAEFVEMKRAEKNASGKSIDTICGYVRGRSASGLDTGDRPFLYLVQEDQAYIGLYDIATSRYPSLCDK